MDILSLQLFRVAVIPAATTQCPALDVRGYDVIGVQKDATLPGTSLTFFGTFDGVGVSGSLPQIFDASNAAVTITTTTLTAALHLFQQVKELRGLNQFALATNSAPAGAINVVIGLRWIT